MFSVIKNKGNIVKAYKLGSESLVIKQLIEKGKIKLLENGKYEIFSQEAIKAGTGHGEVASIGDYIKVDSTGSPYPNDSKFFCNNHRHIAGDEYEQIPKALLAWSADEPMCDEIQFLIEEKGLVLDAANPQKFYTAPLWGTIEAADINSVLVFYSITYKEDGEIEEATFNLVEGTEFEKTYSRC